MPYGMLRALAIAVAAICFSDGAFAGTGGRLRHASASVQGSASPARSADAHKAAARVKNLKPNAARALAAERDRLVDPAAPYKANRLSTPQASQPILNIPGQTTVLTRQVLDDMNATSLRGALRSTAGVTVR